MTSELKLTPIQEQLENLDELKDTTTSGLVSYGLRTGCLDSEYHLALRLQELRVLCLKLVEDSLEEGDRKSTRLNSSHQIISYAVFCLKKKKIITNNKTNNNANTRKTQSTLTRKSTAMR